jgi:hypothetical protein
VGPRSVEKKVAGIPVRRRAAQALSPAIVMRHVHNLGREGPSDPLAAHRAAGRRLHSEALAPARRAPLSLHCAGSIPRSARRRIGGCARAPAGRCRPLQRACSVSFLVIGILGRDCRQVWPGWPGYFARTEELSKTWLCRGGRARHHSGGRGPLPLAPAGVNPSPWPPPRSGEGESGFGRCLLGGRRAPPLRGGVGEGPTEASLRRGADQEQCEPCIPSD